MFGGSSKRSRQTRTSTVRGPATVWTKAADFFRDRGKMLRLGLCLLSIAGLWFVTKAWSIPLGYHRNYTPARDIIQLPPFEAFRSAESYYATLAHELTHWTRHPSRLDRDFGQARPGDEGYAREELVAELGAAFLSADLELTPETRDDHAAYLESWLRILKSDKRALFQAAAHAQRAVNFLQGYQAA